MMFDRARERREQRREEREVFGIRGTATRYRMRQRHEIDDGDRKVAEVSKKWFRLTDTYGVQIEPSQNDILILAVTVAIDIMSHA